MSEAPRWIAIAEIGRPKGLKGEFFVRLYNPDSELLQNIERVLVGEASYEIEQVAPQNKNCVVRFKGVTSRDEAARLTGKQISVRREELPVLPAGENYCCDVVGLSVETESGEQIGKVAEILPTGANDVYVVRDGEKELLLPAIGEVIKRVDLEAGKVIVSLQEEEEVSDAV